MPTPSDIDARKYYRVAQQRLEDGELLIENDRWKAAIYLSGYAVECVLKSLLIVNTPSGERREVAIGFRGSRGHDLTWLLESLRVRGVREKDNLIEDVIFVSSWTTDLRYEPGPGDATEAVRFHTSSSRIVDWADTLL